ncbi:alpha/beta fold hydrolase [Limibacter armeniacum]|uniref:YheT family hydrolase n=1 Tax=Limibacter armeniacum TaxID=466084 RepID=UPI002FE5D139
MVTQTTYRPPFLFRKSHLSTIYPALFRKVRDVDYKRQRIFTPDDDFLDLDWSKVGSHRCVIVAHGLEGNAELAYVKGVVRMANARKWDAVGLNYRGCSGEPNWRFRSYHSGATDDIGIMINQIIAQGNYNEVFLVGFSLGGNLILKYAGELGANTPAAVNGIVAISVPCDLEASADYLSRPSGYLYRNRFLKFLKEKARTKIKFREAKFTLKDISKIRSFEDYDNLYTAPAHGFANARTYWRENSCKHFIPNIKVPTLILNAINDPLLAPDSHPVKETDQHSFVKLMLTKYGGHVGFYDAGNQLYWHEKQILQFLMKHIG